MAFDRRLTPARPDLAAEHLRGMVEAERFVAGRLMHVAVDVTDLKVAPSADAAIDTQALFGEEVMVYDMTDGGANDWAWGQLKSDDYVGYFAASALADGGIATTHRLIVPRSFIYPGASMKLPIAGSLPLNARLAVVGEDGEFLKLAQGGFVFAKHAAPAPSQAPDFVAVAELFLNVPYLWGGKSALGIDCSGLVQTGLAAAAIAAPRDTDLQEKALGVELDVNEPLRRGDLIFWKGHVGIMRDAQTLLHANAHHMLVASEPLTQARERIKAKTGQEITSIRRLK